jgi:ribosomal protein S18 acetylase RimI-like enzyme
VAPRVRAAVAADRDFVLREVERLADFELPAWRSKPEIWQVERRMLAGLFDRDLAEAEGLLVAEGEGGERLGFALLERPRDFFTGADHAHVGIVVAARAAEGRGVGRLLMTAAEAWAKERGLPFVTLNVFGVNARARALYERLGYRVETIKYRKDL